MNTIVRWPVRTLLTSTVVIGITGCGRSQQAIEADAIRAVVQHDTELKKHMYEPELREWAPGYVREMRSVDLTKCPTDFAESYQLHLQTWEELVLYQSQVDGALMVIYALVFDDANGKFIAYDAKLAETWREVERIALRHGVQVPRTVTHPLYGPQN